MHLKSKIRTSFTKNTRPMACLITNKEVLILNYNNERYVNICEGNIYYGKY